MEQSQSSGQIAVLDAEEKRPERARGRWTRRGVWETSFLVAGLFLHFMLLPKYIVGDGYSRYLELSQLLSGHGIPVSRYSLIGPLFAAPLWYLGALASAPVAGLAAFNSILFALGLLAFYFILRDVMDRHVLRVFLLLLTFASMFSYHILHFYGEVFTALFVALGLMLITLRSARGAFAGVVMVMLGVANTPVTVAAIALVAIKRVWDTRRLRYLSLALAPLALALAEAWLRRGSPLATGYGQVHGVASIMPFSGRPGFSYPLLFGLLAIFLSFGKGLLFFTPGLFLPVRRHFAALWGARSPIASMYTLWLLFVAGLVLVYAKWWGWNGDWFWGPRFFLFACVPASFALALWTQRPANRLSLNLLALLALALSVWVGIEGPLFDQATLGVCYNNDMRLLPYCNFTPDFSALWRPLVNAYLYGIGPRFMAMEGLTPRSLTYGGFVLFIGVYIAAPLLRAIWLQTRAELAVWAPRVVDVARGLRF